MQSSTLSKIFLIGMPGCGKSSVGKVLAERLQYTFLDLDTLLEEQEGSSVGQVFEQRGQDYFREAEARALRSVADRKGGLVLATGGGAPCFHENLVFMRQQGIVVYLKVSVPELVNRLTELDLQVRPLLRSKSKEELLAYLTATLVDREIFYRQADVVVRVDNQNVVSAAKEVSLLLAKVA